jgi:glycosyltransferase involved in cell wall biosynthesis
MRSGLHPQFCADAFRTGTDLPIEVVPHHVTIDKDAPLTITRADLEIAQDAFMGLSIMDLQSCPERKNPWAHIRAWRLAFGDDPSAILVMKLRVGKRTKYILHELEELAGQSNNITILTNDFDYADLFSLQKSSDVVLSLHRSEGYGLTLAEGLALDIVGCRDGLAESFEHRRWKPVAFNFQVYSDWFDHYTDRNFSLGRCVDFIGCRLFERCSFVGWFNE